MQDKDSKQPSKALLRWYDAHLRVMPWRALPGKKPNPYHVLVSEFMLQQTGVKTVIPYFNAFIKRWPKISDLAKARLESVREAWAGLGYYRRAGFLHECAKAVVQQFNGVIPADEMVLRELPGLGPYAAAAVSAIAFGRKASVVDGNVERVIARVYAMKETGTSLRKRVTVTAEKLVPETRCGDYAQAIMELGALVCTPRSPDCPSCPWKKNCMAFAAGEPEKYPVKQKAKRNPDRYADLYVVQDAQGRLLLRKRPEAGLLAGMWEFPSNAWQAEATKGVPKGMPAAKWRDAGEIIHVFSHFALHLRLRVGHAKTIFLVQDKNWRWVPWPRLSAMALPTVMRKAADAAKPFLDVETEKD